MDLTGIFEFVSPELIRIKGTRVDIEIVIEKYLNGASPEEIRRHHPHLTLKHIYGTITYYLFNKEKIDAYIETRRKQAEATYEEQRKNPSAGVKRLMKIKAQRKAHNCNPVKHRDEQKLDAVLGVVGHERTHK